VQPLVICRINAVFVLGNHSPASYLPGDIQREARDFEADFDGRMKTRQTLMQRTNKFDSGQLTVTCIF